jgi:hypothetical protein
MNKKVIFYIFILHIILFFVIFFFNNKINEYFDSELKNIIIKNDAEQLLNFIIQQKLFTTLFIKNNFKCDTTKFKKCIRDISKIEKSINRPIRKSLIYQISPNIVDLDYKIRDSYNWKCQICNISCLNNKDLLDIHTKSGVFYIKNILKKEDVIVCCRLCHYNINPNDHQNLVLTNNIINRIHILRNLL